MAIPNKDAELLNWADNFDTRITASPVTYGLAAGDAGAIAAVVGPFKTALAAYTPETRTKALVAAKNAARAAMLPVLRAYYRMIQADASVSNENKVLLGITLLDGQGEDPMPYGLGPMLEVQAGGPQTHTLRYRDVGLDGHRRPSKVTGLLVEMKVGDGPREVCGVFTKPNEEVTFDQSKKGQNVQYFARWIANNGVLSKYAPDVQVAVP